MNIQKPYLKADEYQDLDSTINRYEIVGRLGREPKHTQCSNGSKVVTLSVATKGIRKKAGRDEYEESVDWHRVNLFGKQAEYAMDNCNKGSRVYVQGSMKINTWQDENGNTKKIFYLAAERFYKVN